MRPKTLTLQADQITMELITKAVPTATALHLYILLTCAGQVQNYFIRFCICQNERFGSMKLIKLDRVVAGRTRSRAEAAQ